MNKDIMSPFNSPIPQTCTPIRRLGLSRKRKKCNSKEEELHNKVQAHLNDVSDTPTYTHYINQSDNPNEENIVVKHETDNSIKKIANNDNFVLVEDRDEDLDEIKKRIEEKEEKLKSLNKKSNKILELENLIEIWKNGCKNVYLYLIEIIKKNENDNFDFKKILENLGVWHTMVEIFQNDPDISLVEDNH